MNDARELIIEPKIASAARGIGSDDGSGVEERDVATDTETGTKTGTETRLCIVGGGSPNWTPTLLQDLALTPGLAGRVVLHDLDQGAAETMARLGRRIVASAGSELAVEAVADLAEALRGAAFVVLTITTGGLAAMRHDLEIPLRYGIVQTVGDTVGPGGVSRALRNIPVVVEIARAMERLCPDAWLLNLSNPLAALTRAVAATTAIKVVGLCHEPEGVRRTLAAMYRVAADDVHLSLAGVNHLSWVLDLAVAGRACYREVRDDLAGGREIPIAAPAEGYPDPFQDGWRVKLALLADHDLLAAAGDRHLAEFFPSFLSAEAEGGAAYGVRPTTIEQRAALAERAWRRVRDRLAGEEPVPVARSREAVAAIVAAVAVGRSHECVVNLPNRGQIDELPRGAVVETVGVVGPAGGHGLAVGALPGGVLGTLHRHVANQELVVAAALDGDRRLALEALVGDPLVGDRRVAPRLLDELLRANERFLPRFAA